MFGKKKEQKLVKSGDSIKRLAEEFNPAIALSKEESGAEELRRLQRTVGYFYPKAGDELNRLEKKIKSCVDDVKDALTAKNFDAAKYKTAFAALERAVAERESKN